MLVTEVFFLVFQSLYFGLNTQYDGNSVLQKISNKQSYERLLTYDTTCESFIIFFFFTLIYSIKLIKKHSRHEIVPWRVRGPLQHLSPTDKAHFWVSPFKNTFNIKYTRHVTCRLGNGSVRVLVRCRTRFRAQTSRRLF